MEKIYDPTTFRASDNFAAKEYFEEYKQICNFQYLDVQIPSKRKNQYRANQIQYEMGITLNKTAFEQLEQSCSLSKLTLASEPPDIPIEIPDKLQTKTKLTAVYPKNDDAKHLSVIKCREVLDKRYNLDQSFKFGKKRFLKTATVVDEVDNSKKYDMLPGSNFVYSIIVYRPFSLSFIRNSAEKLRFAYEIEALGTNTLAQVADTIVCLANIGLYKEVENTNVDLGPFMNAKNHYPSQSIFIDGIFYNDTRSPNTQDYSSKIVEWASEKGIGNFHSEIMEQTLLESLTPRLGYPYVYMHQGNCEHILTFSDIRLLQPSDCLNSKKYPRQTSLSRPCNVMCFICGTTHSKWIVTNCEKFPQEKVFLCTGCCNSYLYVDRKKIVDFQLYPYYDEELMTRHINDEIICID